MRRARARPSCWGLDLADRGDRPRPRDRHPRSRACPARFRSGRATASGARPSSARRSAPSPAGRSTADPKESGQDRLRPRRARRPQPGRPSCASSATPPVWSPRDKAIVIERFRDEIGDWRLCVLSPYGGPRPRRLGPRARRPQNPRRTATSRPTRSGPTTGSSSTSPTPTSSIRPALAELVLVDPDELEDLVVGELSGSAPCSAPASVRTPVAPC